MTDEEIDKMPAGPEIDLLIAKMMGYPILDITPPCDHNVTPYMTHIAVFSPAEIHYHKAFGNKGKNYSWGIWEPSRDITQAWEVVAKLRDIYHIRFELWWNGKCPEELRFAAEPHENQWGCFLNGRSLKNVYADTAPLAISRAALKAINNG